jgi:hypothetical protein
MIMNFQTDFRVFECLVIGAYLSARRHFSLFRELFRLMSAAQLPELSCEKHMQYLFTSFRPSLSDDEAANAMKGMLSESVRTWSRQIDDAMHIIAHPKK